MKAQRQAAIIKKLKQHVITSQDQITRMLADEGFEVSQTTVSRDMRELGLTKGRDGNGNVRYGSAETLAGGGASEAGLKRMAPQFILSAESTGNLVVVRTTLGNAQGVAAAIDAACLDGIAGTVGGDDTIIIVCSNGVSSPEIARTLLEYAGNRG